MGAFHAGAELHTALITHETHEVITLESEIGHLTNRSERVGPGSTSRMTKPSDGAEHHRRNVDVAKPENMGHFCTTIKPVSLDL
jgi:ABC-type nitrate/sulfonate/bicarbonate transport system ATPase subunit